MEGRSESSREVAARAAAAAAVAAAVAVAVAEGSFPGVLGEGVELPWAMCVGGKRALAKAAAVAAARAAAAFACAGPEVVMSAENFAAVAAALAGASTVGVTGPSATTVEAVLPGDPAAAPRFGGVLSACPM